MLTARPLAGQPTPSSESSEVRWVPDIRGSRVHDGPLDAHPHQRLPSTQRVTSGHLGQSCWRSQQVFRGRPVAGSWLVPYRLGVGDRTFSWLLGSGNLTYLVTTTPVSARPSVIASDLHNALTCENQT